MFKKFVTALQFLTIATVRKDHQIEEGDLSGSMAFFPVVGFLIGLVLVYADKVFALITLPQSLANLMLVVLAVLMTRALHIDGLADTLDGLMGGRDRSSRLAIMKDSRLGTAGALGIVFVVTLKYLSLNSLFNSEKVAALLTAPLLARWSQTIMAFKIGYGREDGMGKAFVGRLQPGVLAAASAVAIGLSAFVIVREEARTLFLVLILIAAVALFTLGARRYLVHKLGGMTGDAIGAVSELNEVLVLLLCVVFAAGS